MRPDLGLQPMNELMTFGAFVLGIGILMSMVNLLVSVRSGALAGKNPWNSDGLEWETDSPPKPYATIAYSYGNLPAIHFGTITTKKRTPMTIGCSMKLA